MKAVVTIKKPFSRFKTARTRATRSSFSGKKERKSFREVLEILVESGMDSLPGPGAEILSDRVRKTISPGKCSTQDWLDVMREARKMNLVTSATMMFGHIETKKERLEHLIRLREGIQQAIRDAGFEPQYRNQAYKPDELPGELLEN